MGGTLRTESNVGHGYMGMSVHFGRLFWKGRNIGADDSTVRNFSAGFDRYDWKEEEKFSADIWLLNDCPEKVGGRVSVELVTAEQTIKLLDWEAQAEANSNVQGPTVHATLPMSEEDFFVLRLKADDGMENEYQLLLRHRPRKVKKLRELNL